MARPLGQAGFGGRVSEGVNWESGPGGESWGQVLNKRKILHRKRKRRPTYQLQGQSRVVSKTKDILWIKEYTGVSFEGTPISRGQEGK